MQGAEFVNDLRSNYLTFPYIGEERDFALRMLMENAADVFLPVELRRLDGQAYLYYNISGMQSMEIIYAEKTIDREAFRGFMQQLHEAALQSRELFLPGEGICLEPSALFWNLGAQRWEFLYIPKRDDGERTEIQSEKERFAEFLVMRIDYEDKELTDTVYHFYEEICAGRMCMDFLPERIEAGEWKEAEAELRETAGEECNAEETVLIADAPDDEMEEKTQETGKTSKGGGFLKLLAILWCTAVCAVFILGRTMQNVIVPGAAAAAVTAAVLLFIWIRQRHPRGEKTLPLDDEPYMENENFYFPYAEEETAAEDAGEEEKTVYMDIEPVQERKLYGIGKFRQQKIFLEGLPCVVGKDKTMVNHIISDTSVSRMHARFFSDKEALWMQDLNSTNGTYHNGLRLRPNEKVMLEPEDEVGFGRVQFVYR